MFNPALTGFAVDDLDWLRNELNFAAHLELDPWGSLIVSPTTDEHEIAAAALARQSIAQLSHVISVNGFAWTVPGGTGYLMKPDLIVLARGWRRVDELHFDPAPLLVIEIASPSTRHVDRSRKLADYHLGGAGLYLLVDPPATFELHDFAAGRVTQATGTIDLVVGGQPLHLSLPPA